MLCFVQFFLEYVFQTFSRQCILPEFSHCNNLLFFCCIMTYTDSGGGS